MKQVSKENYSLKSYLNESSKTLSGKFYYDPNFESEPDVYHYAQKAIKACQDLDLVKKKKFYNKDVNITSSVPSDLKFYKEDSGENTLHAAIGLTTECGEILEAVMKHKYCGLELDTVNIKEEIGDLMWYMAILLRDHDIDLFDAMETNIKKLRARYGEKFSTDKAIYRDLDIERTILESKNHIVFSGSTSLNEVVDTRLLTNGGMAPPKKWQSIDNIKLSDNTKNSLIEEMRAMKQNGDTIWNKGNNYKHIPISIDEFTKPFQYLENMSDYTGGFLVTLLKTEFEINNKARLLNVDLSNELQKCLNGELLVLDVFDISGAESKGEDKKFFIILKFDKLNGVLCLEDVVHTRTSKNQLSNKQKIELEKFCKTKKIIYNS